MEKSNELSENYRKYLVKVIYQQRNYFTVLGADSTDNEADKVVVDEENRWMLFAQQTDLFKEILKKDSFFDSKQLREWAQKSVGIKKPYTSINFDELAAEHIDATPTAAVYSTLDIIRDYALQVSNQELIRLMESEVVLTYQDTAADHFLWSPEKTAEVVILPAVITAATNDIYQVLGKCITIVSDFSY